MSNAELRQVKRGLEEIVFAVFDRDYDDETLREWRMAYDCDQWPRGLRGSPISPKRNDTVAYIEFLQAVLFE